MKRLILRNLLVIAGAFALSAATAQVSENFNTRPGVADVKGDLQDHCWYLPGMDINAAGWNPSIEGDGALVSGVGASPVENTGIYTPLLDVPGYLATSFKYKFSGAVTYRRWMKIYLVDYNNEIYMLLDSVELTGRAGDLAYQYTNTFGNLPSGAYRLYFNYQGINGSTRIAIDELQVNVPLKYNGGCNHAPVVTDNQIAGNANHTASGKLGQNNYDPDGDYFTYYLISNSPNGNVLLNNDGSFTFSPNAGFAGTSTTFTYQACDNGFAPMCSTPATVTLNFPAAGMLPAKLVDFAASINDANEVNIRWTTTFESGTDRFEIERSTDGMNFKTVGQVKCAENSQSRTDYNFTDRLHAGTLNRKDVYYRLKLVDLNTRVELSKILVLRLLNSASAKTIAVTPNPVRNDINVQVQLKENSYVVMKITSTSGTEVARKSTHGNAGLNLFSLDGTSNLLPGIYMLEVIINSKERMLTRLVKN